MNKYSLKHMPIKLTYFQLSEQNFEFQKMFYVLNYSSILFYEKK